MLTRSAGDSSHELVIIDIDEKSLENFGQWPWPRYRMATLVEKLNLLGASVIGLDILFPEADRTSLNLLKNEIERDLNITIQLDSPGSYDNDRMFARALENSNTVLGYRFIFEHTEGSQIKYQPHYLNTILRQPSPSSNPLRVYRALGLTGNIEELSNSASSSGFINYLPDVDGVIRRVPMIIEYHDKFYPSFSLATIMQFLQTQNVMINAYGDKVESLSVAGKKVPLDGNGNLVLRYSGGQDTFTSFSAATVLNDTIQEKHIKGKIILIGTSAAGLQDRHPTPIDPVFPGIQIHATIIDNFLTNHYFNNPIWAKGVEFVLVIILGVIATFFLARTTPVLSVLFILLSTFAIWSGSYLLLHTRGIILNPQFPILVLLTNFTFLTVFRFWLEQREVKKRTRELLMAQDTAILSMTALTETRDNETGGHIIRTQHYVKALARQLSKQEKYKKILSDNTIELLFRSAPLHDIGKVGISDQILLNPGKLTKDEFENMKQHTQFGYDILVKAESRLKIKVVTHFFR